MSRVVVTRCLPEDWLEPLTTAGHEIVQPSGPTPFEGLELHTKVADADALCEAGGAAW